MKRIATLIFSVLAAVAFSQGATITQIDTSGLLAAQNVRLYVDAHGLPDGDLEKALSLRESSDGAEFGAPRPVRILKDANRDEGITFLFLVDNSGSMWDGLSGQAAASEAERRISHAKEAMSQFLRGMSQRDKVGLAVFNTRYWLAVAPDADPAKTERALAEVMKPTKDDAYTELYTAMPLAVSALAEYPGRKVLIVLSDGENFPFFAKTGKPNPQFGETSAKPADCVEALNREGITAYAVHFGGDRDPELKETAVTSGGSSFDARDKDELSGIYGAIRANVLSELAVEYTPSMQKGERRYVQLSWTGQNGAEVSATRWYYTSSLLGWTDRPPAWFLLCFVLVPLAFWLFLLFFKLERETSRAGISLLYGATGTATRAFALDAPRTVIGGGANADITLSGNPSLAAGHATILFDQKTGEYTVVADSPVTVNNRPVKSRKLEAGDVINMAGTVVVFDDNLTKMS